MNSSLIKVLNGDAPVMLKQALGNELAAQGHFLSGKASKTMTHEVVSIPNGVRLSIFGVGYMEFLEKGFKRASWKQLPFLIRYFQQRGIPMPEAKRIAGATIATWIRKGGMPTAGSYRYSPNGRRLHFVDLALDEIGEDVERKITEAVWEDIAIDLNNAFKKAA